jgi:glycosyltransferase involved in cell wall biosynthesis
MPAISILLSALNAQSTLAQALDSVAAQTYPDWECLMTDDGSADQTRAVMERYQARDARFRMIIHDKPQGLTTSLIESAREARGQFLARQDADDWSEPNRLMRQMEAFRQSPGVVAIGSRFAVHDTDGRYLDVVESVSNSFLARRMLRRRNPFAHGSLLFSRSAYERVGGYRSRFRYAQDYDLLLRLSEVGDITALDKTLYHHRLSMEGIGRSRRVQQAAYADLALACARERSRGGDEEGLLKRFTEPGDAPTAPQTVNPILLHLIKSGQRDAARERLSQWHPINGRERVAKWTLSFLNASPLLARQAVVKIYRLQQFL